MSAAVVSVERDGAASARAALEDCVGAGGVAVFPADGLYGVCCDPLNATAVARIHRLKGRDEGKPSAVMYFAPLVMREVLGDQGPAARGALAALLPGPVTLVIANPTHRYPLACRADPERLGVRLIDGPLAGVRAPIFQTSANRSGEPAPSRLHEVDEAIVAGADLAIDGGTLTGLPSTVVDLTRLDVDGSWEVLREGAMGGAELERRLAALATAGPRGR
jgi:L-threonylcarbamoyladenylate synthase